MTFDTRTVPVRWTWLSKMDLSAQHAAHAAKTCGDDTGSIAMRFGIGVHAVAFGQPFEVFRETSPKTGKVWNRNAKAWDEFEAACKAAGAHPLMPDEYDDACRIRDALYADRDASRLLFGPGVINEGPISWKRDGRDCSSRLDARKPGGWIADLKSCRSAQPKRFQNVADWYGYLGQLAFYEEADAFATGRDVEANPIPLYIVAIESAAPHAIVTYELDEAARAKGRRTVDRHWRALMLAESSQVWSGYSQSIVPLTVDAANDEPTELDFATDAGPFDSATWPTDDNEAA